MAIKQQGDMKIMYPTIRGNEVGTITKHIGEKLVDCDHGPNKDNMITNKFEFEFDDDDIEYIWYDYQYVNIFGFGSLRECFEKEQGPNMIISQGPLANLYVNLCIFTYQPKK